VVFGRAEAAVDTPVYRRATLGAGDRFTGPAIVEERETTAVIRPGWNVEVAHDGSLVATRTATGAK
jgi:N-methylhydantoinase A